MTVSATTPIQPLFNGAGSGAATGAETQDGATRATLSSDFETFLQMLTVQMQNQDPLNPIESSDYAVQLATFSSVEQQVLTNDLLAALGAQLSNIEAVQAPSWVGLEARSTSPGYFDGEPIDLVLPTVSSSYDTTLIVRDDLGNVTQQLDITGLSGRISWAGVDSGGVPVATGTYAFSVEVQSDGQTVATHPVETFNRIVETRMIDGEVFLITEGGAEIRPEGITGLRDS